MKYLIFSDIQGNYPALQNFINRIIHLNRDYSICLGDIVNGKKIEKDNLCLQIVSEKTDKSIRGNHENILIKNKDYDSRISLENRCFLDNLNSYFQKDDLVFFHSSLQEEDKRLQNTQDYLMEMHYILKNFPSFSIAFHGHTHKMVGYSYDPKLNSITSISETKNIKIDPEKKYIFNPGGIGLYFGIPNTFITYDDNSKLVNFYSISELINKSDKVNIAYLFEERWMPGLSHENLGHFPLYSKLDSKDIKKHMPLLISVAEILDSFDYERYHKVGKHRKVDYIREYSSDLADEINKLTCNFDEEFKFPNPHETRNFYLNMIRRQLGGIIVDTNFRKIK